MRHPVYCRSVFEQAFQGAAVPVGERALEYPLFGEGEVLAAGVFAVVPVSSFSDMYRRTEEHNDYTYTHLPLGMIPPL